MNRWSKSGVLDRVFEELQQAQDVRIKIEAVSRDGTVVKAHPDGTGALKKTARDPSARPAAGGPPRFIRLPRMLGRNVFAVTGSGTRGARRPCMAEPAGTAQSAAAPARGSRLRG